MSSYFSKMINRLFEKTEATILMLGLYATGKTTILFKMKLGEVVHSIFMVFFSAESI